MIATRRRQLLTAAALVTAATLFIAVTPVNAHFFGGRFADSRDHHFVSQEGTNYHHFILDDAMTVQMAHLDAVTVMWDVKRARFDYVSWVDLYWYATPATNMSSPTTVASVVCQVGIGSDRCDRFRMKYNENYINNPSAEIRHDVCHEILHSVGADDGGSFSDGCLGSNQTATNMNSHEIGHIDANH